MKIGTKKEVCFPADDNVLELYNMPRGKYRLTKVSKNVIVITREDYDAE